MKKNMWTATITSMTKESGILNVSIGYTDGTTTLTRTERLSEPESLNSIIFSQLRQLNKISDFDTTTFTTKPLTVDDVEPIPQPLPVVDPAIQAQDDYISKRQKLVQAKQDLDLGLIAQTDFDTILTDAKSAQASLI